MARVDAASEWEKSTCPSVKRAQLPWKQRGRRYILVGWPLISLFRLEPLFGKIGAVELEINWELENGKLTSHSNGKIRFLRFLQLFLVGQHYSEKDGQKRNA